MGAQPMVEDSAAHGAQLFGRTGSAQRVLGKSSTSLLRQSRVGNTEQGPGSVHHATASRVVKGEDVLSVHPLGLNSQPQCLMYMVCDGHCGVEASNFVASNFLRILNPKLPAKLPNFSNSTEVDAFAEHLRRALCETFVILDNEWSTTGHFAGTTVTVALATGWLLTVANTGDSSAVLDTGLSMLELIKSHRIQCNLEEQARLKNAQQCLAPLGFHLQGPAKPGEQGVGPLRLWPGGLCVSRSVGDLDAGPEVVPVPHIRQVLLPRDGCRVIIASDGLWDVLSYTKAIKLTRSKPTGAAASALITAVSRDLRTMDDTSIIVVDLLPSEATSFPTVALRATSGGPHSGALGASNGVPEPRKKKGGFFSCFRPDPDEPDSREIPVGGMGHVTFLCDVDCLVAYPTVKQMLARQASVNKPLVLPHKANTDFTLHGGVAYQPPLPVNLLAAGANGKGMVPGGGMNRSISMVGLNIDPSNHSVAAAAHQADHTLHSVPSQGEPDSGSLFQ